MRENLSSHMYFMTLLLKSHMYFITLLLLDSQTLRITFSQMEVLLFHKHNFKLNVQQLARMKQVNILYNSNIFHYC